MQDNTDCKTMFHQVFFSEGKYLSDDIYISSFRGDNLYDCLRRTAIFIFYRLFIINNLLLILLILTHHTQQ